MRPAAGVKARASEVYDPRTGKPLKFSYGQQGDDPENHAIRATFRCPCRKAAWPRLDL